MQFIEHFFLKTVHNRVVVIFLVTLSFSCESRVDTERENARLFQTDVEFSKKSLEVGAAEAFRLFLADDALQLPPQAQPVFGREEIYKNMQEGSVAYALQWEPKKAEVAKSGDLGYTWGIYTISWKDEQRNPSYGKYVNVWRKQKDGSWKVIIDIGNPSPPPKAE